MSKFRNCLLSLIWMTSKREVFMHVLKKIKLLQFLKMKSLKKCKSCIILLKLNLYRKNLMNIQNSNYAGNVSKRHWKHTGKI